MKTPAGFVWLASYPKSGNTWLRIVFSNLRRQSDEPVNINDLDRDMAADRVTFEKHVGYAAADLTHDEIDELRPELYRFRALIATEPIFSKVHEAQRRLPSGADLFPPDASIGAIYLVRNPLDVCVSYAAHAGKPPDAIVSAMLDERFTMLGDTNRAGYQLRQRVSAWSSHVVSWVDQAGMPVHVVRYEDMHERPLETFAAAAAFAALPCAPDAVAKAVRFSRIEELQRQERRDGFVEQAQRRTPFFRSGGVGGWRSTLTDAQAGRLIEAHAETMRRFGYLTAAGEPVY